MTEIATNPTTQTTAYACLYAFVFNSIASQSTTIEVLAAIGSFLAGLAAIYTVLVQIVKCAYSLWLYWQDRKRS